MADIILDDTDEWREPAKPEYRVFTIIVQFSDGSVDHIYAHNELQMQRFTSDLNRQIAEYRDGWFPKFDRKKRVPVSFRVDSDWSPYARHPRDY